MGGSGGPGGGRMGGGQPPQMNGQNQGQTKADPAQCAMQPLA